jgi:hypothetical protein
MMASDINTQLLDYYSKILGNLKTIRLSSGGLSNPHLLSVPPEYLQVNNRIMIVGQQAGGWNDEMPADDQQYLVALMNLYTSFIESGKSNSSPFWQAAIDLQRLVNPGYPSKAFIWSNLVKIDQYGNRPPFEIEDKIRQLGILQEEIKITYPKVVVFFTGPSYDSCLKLTFPNVQFVPESGLLLRLEHPNLPYNSYRTSHPKYLRLSRNWDVIEQIAKGIKFAH